MKILRGCITTALMIFAIGMLILSAIGKFFPDTSYGKCILSNFDKISTSLATIVALYTAIIANQISEKAFLYSEEPHIQCYLTTYKTEHRTPYIVLVTENAGNIIARNIKLTITYPEGIEQSEFAKEAKHLNNIPFSLAPKAKLSTPITWNNKKGIVCNGTITITGSYEYQDVYGKNKKEQLTKLELTTDEFDLFNAINIVEEHLNEKAENANE